MNTNIQGDFQICITVPLTEKHKKTVHRKLKDPPFFYIVELFTVFKSDLKRFRNAQLYENVCKLFDKFE